MMQSSDFRNKTTKSLIQNRNLTFLSSKSGPNEAYMKVQILKASRQSAAQQQQQSTYLVTSQGVVGSTRTARPDGKPHGDVTVGRQTLAEDKTRPNDIMLSVNDLAISRTHCRIVYEEGFLGSKRLISDAWFEFSKLFSPVRQHFYRQSRHAVRYLPRDIRRIILSYYRHKRAFMIQDLGSVHGTYI